MNAKAIKGTMELHAAVPLGNSEIAVRATSCFCDKCFGEFHPHCDEWKVHYVLIVNILSTEKLITIWM